jgi:hypothetical protein
MASFRREEAFCPVDEEATIRFCVLYCRVCSLTATIAVVSPRASTPGCLGAETPSPGVPERYVLVP